MFAERTDPRLPNTGLLYWDRSGQQCLTPQAHHDDDDDDNEKWMYD
jgi:hypothetical protein